MMSLGFDWPLLNHFLDHCCCPSRKQAWVGTTIWFVAQSSPLIDRVDTRRITDFYRELEPGGIIDILIIKSALLRGNYGWGGAKITLRKFALWYIIQLNMTTGQTTLVLKVVWHCFACRRQSLLPCQSSSNDRRTWTLLWGLSSR